MKTVIPTRSQLGYANGSPHAFVLVPGQAIEVPDDLAAALIGGGDAVDGLALPAPAAEPVPVRRRRARA